MLVFKIGPRPTHIKSYCTCIFKYFCDQVGLFILLLKLILKSISPSLRNYGKGGRVEEQRICGIEEANSQ